MQSKKQQQQKPPQKSTKKNAKPMQLLAIYAIELDQALSFLWWPLKFALKVPFVIAHKKQSIQVQVNRKSPWFYMCCLMTLLLWIVWIWLSAGVANLEFGQTPISPNITINGVNQDNPEFLLRELELDLLGRYFSNVFIIWTVLFHASVASLHLVLTCEDHASFIRDWYKAVDIARLKPINGLVLYILLHLAALIGITVLLIVAFIEKRTVPGIYGSANVMVLVLVRLFLTSRDDLQMLNSDDQIYYARYAPIGLAVYIFAIFSSRLNLLFFMVMCRVFRESSHLMNRRFEMALGQRRIRGENAVHLDYLNMYKDHLQVSALGKQLGSVFSYPIVFYYSIQMLCITLELSAIAYFDFSRPNTGDGFIQGTYILMNDQPVHIIINSICHLSVSVLSFFYISLEAARAGEVAMEAFDITRRQGLVLSVNERERNFVRSMWYSGGAKNPILIKPANMFTLNRALIGDVLGTAFFYFVLMWQFKYNQQREIERRQRRFAPA